MVLRVVSLIRASDPSESAPQVTFLQGGGNGGQLPKGTNVVFSGGRLVRGCGGKGTLIVFRVKAGKLGMLGEG